MTNLEICTEGFKTIKKTKIKGLSNKPQLLFQIQEAIDMLNGNFPEYMTKALKQNQITQVEFDQHSERTIQSALNIIENFNGEFASF